MVSFVALVDYFIGTRDSLAAAATLESMRVITREDEQRIRFRIA
jgi:hypothetical protein